MKRDDPILLPICQKCGRYKGVGTCGCEGSREMTDVSTKCSLCENTGTIACTRCGRRYCEVHGKEEVKGHLTKWNQRIGTCTICDQSVCENCWILEDNGLITCLAHHDGPPHD